jgi:hypothetical protein
MNLDNERLKGIQAEKAKLGFKEFRATITLQVSVQGKDEDDAMRTLEATVRNTKNHSLSVKTHKFGKIKLVREF